MNLLLLLFQHLPVRKFLFILAVKPQPELHLCVLLLTMNSSYQRISLYCFLICPSKISYTGRILNGVTLVMSGVPKPNFATFKCGIKQF